MNKTNETLRLELAVEAVRYCQRLPSAYYSNALTGLEDRQSDLEQQPADN